MASIYEKAGTILQNVTEVNNDRDTLEETLNPCQLGLELYDGEDVYNPRVVFRGYNEENSAHDGYWRMARLDELQELERRIDELGGTGGPSLTFPLTIAQGGTERTTRQAAAYNLMQTSISIDDIGEGDYVCVINADNASGGRVGIDRFRSRIFDRGFGDNPGDLSDSVYSWNPVIGTVNVTANGPNLGTVNAPVYFTGWAYIINIPHGGGGNSTYRLQILTTPRNTTALPTMYIRKYAAGSWTVWTEIGGNSGPSNQYVLKSGDTMTGRLVIAYGNEYPDNPAYVDEVSLSAPYIHTSKLLYPIYGNTRGFDLTTMTITDPYQGMLHIRSNLASQPNNGFSGISIYGGRRTPLADGYAKYGYIQFNEYGGFVQPLTITRFETFLHIGCIGTGNTSHFPSTVSAAGVRIYDNGDFVAAGDIRAAGSLHAINKIIGDGSTGDNSVRIRFASGAAYLEKSTVDGWQVISWNQP